MRSWLAAFAVLMLAAADGYGRTRNGGAMAWTGEPPSASRRSTPQLEDSQLARGAVPYACAPALDEANVNGLIRELARLDLESARILYVARLAVTELGGGTVEPEHLLFAILHVRPDVVTRFAAPLPSVDSLQENLRATSARTQRSSLTDEVPMSPALHTILASAIEDANRQHATAIRPEHLILGLLCDPQGRAIQLLRRVGVASFGVTPYPHQP